uniref:THAP domain-containing protein 2 n=1 Tax=Cacopsylla melanoneura TaxID=428564 RepID=A0A8D9AAK1_9HEMI
MVTCSVHACENSHGTRGVSFHLFPKKPERLAAWVAVVNKKDWTPKSSSRICSAHFKEEDIDRTSLSVVRIREHAVPTIFPRCQAFPCPCVQRKVVSPFCHQYIK